MAGQNCYRSVKLMDLASPGSEVAVVVVKVLLNCYSSTMMFFATFRTSDRDRDNDSIDSFED